GINDTLRLPQVIDNGLDQYSCVFSHGGHAPFKELANNPEVATIFAHFHRQHKPTPPITHCPNALKSEQPTPSPISHNHASRHHAS
ncbi:hypothetical protein CWC09_19090, partial [Pseudoalteromonas ruthenica]